MTKLLQLMPLRYVYFTLSLVQFQNLVSMTSEDVIESFKEMR